MHLDLQKRTTTLNSGLTAINQVFLTGASILQVVV
jgi:hypothetical protein